MKEKETKKRKKKKKMRKKKKRKNKISSHVLADVSANVLVPLVPPRR